MCNLKYDTNELINEIETDSWSRLAIPKGEGRKGGVDWEFGISKFKILHVEWINNKVLFITTGNYI